MTLARQSDRLYSVDSTIYAARSGDGWVFLDLARDAYSCFYQREAEDSSDENSLISDQILVELGVPAAERAVLSTMVDKSSNSLWIDPTNEPQSTPQLPIFPAMFFSFLLSLAVAGWRFRHRSVQHLIESITTQYAPRQQPDRSIVEIVRAFDTLCLFLPFRPQCLFRCFFLLHFLARAGHAADWVFGATLFPFEAHCWLAQDLVLIGEDSSQAEQYRPILIVPASGRR